jgi:Flp pilus assembly protein TadD
MNRDNFLFALIGLLLGFIIGFMLHGVMSQRNSERPLAGQQTQSMPPNHPPVGNDQAADPQQVFQQVQTAMKQARENPNDFDAQVTAANLEYRVQRYDQATEYLLKANQLRPDNFDALAMLGESNMMAGHFEPAEKWYRAALTKQPDSVMALDGLAAVLISAGKAKPAEETINKLAKLDPTNSDLQQFRDKLAELKRK